MGYTNWSDASYSHFSSARAKKSVDEIFINQIRGKIDPAMDPSGPKRIRESRDSATHPNSNAIIVDFDVTGSMGDVPLFFAKEKLGGLMKLLVSGGYILDPQILFLANGDAYCDEAPLQIGEFESGLEMDEWLTRIWIEGGGGGQVSESYGITHYWAAKHTEIDCFEKRGKKGYLFTMGDELPHKLMTRDQLNRFIGDTVEKDVTIEEAISMASEKYEVFHIHIADGTSHGHEPRIHEGWKKLLGERALILKEKSAVCELIATTIGMCEGRLLAEMEADLIRAGLDKKSVTAVTFAVTPFANKMPARRSATVEGSLPVVASKSGTIRL